MKKIIEFINKIPIWFWGGILCGVIYLIFFGVDELITSNTGWLMDNDDRGLQYLGTLFYIFSDWQFTPGLSDQLAYPLYYSVVYVDSIPLVAFLSKLFLSFTERMDFQYFGIASLINQILMGGFSSALVFKITKSKCAGIISVFFFIVNYPYLSRIFLHFGLQAQWLLIAILYFFVSDLTKNISRKKKILLYFLFGALTVWIHSYFLPPIFISIVLFEITNIHGKKDFLIYLEYVASYMAACLLSLYVLGGTYGKTEYNTGILLGQQGSNLNTFFNPLAQCSKFFPQLPLYASAQHNGSVYLGAGIFLIILCLIYQAIRKYKWQVFTHIFSKIKKYWNFALGIIAICLFALSPTITWNDKVLFKLPFPDFIIQLWGIFRANGRAMWMVMYIIIVYCVYKLFKSYRRNVALLILVLCVVLQIFDFSDKIKSVTNAYGINSSNTYESVLQDSAWQQLSQLGKDKIIFMNGANRNNAIRVNNIISRRNTYEIARFAFQNHMTLNDFYFARINQEVGEYRGEIWEQLYDGIVDKHAIYIFVETPAKLIMRETLNFYMVDGFLIGIEEELQDKEKIEPNSELSIMPLLATSLKNGQYLDGKRIIYPNGTSSGPDIPLDAGEYKLTITGTGLNNATLDVSAKCKYQISDIVREDESIIVDVDLYDNGESFLVFLSNFGDDNIEIEEMKIQLQ